jgi:hypothetical protein
MGLVPARRENSAYLENVAYGAPEESNAAGSDPYIPPPAARGGTGINLMLHPDDHTAVMKMPRLFSIPFDPKVFVDSGILPKVEGFVPPEYEKDYLILCLDILQGFKAIAGEQTWLAMLEQNQVGSIYMMFPSGIRDGKVNSAFPRLFWYGLIGAGGIEHANKLAVDPAALKQIIDDRMAEITSYIQQVDVTIQTIIQTAIAQEAQRQAQVAAAAAQEPIGVDAAGPQTSTEEGPVPGQFVPPSSVATAPTQAPPSIPTDLWAHDFDTPSYSPYYPTESLPSPTLPAILPEEEEKWYDKTENQVVLGLGLLAAGYSIYKWST